MTEAEEPRTEDKHGKDVRPGDRVSFVYGGDHHEMEVGRVVRDGHHWVVEGTVPVRVIVSSVTRARRPHEKKAEEREAHDPAKGHTPVSEAPKTEPKTEERKPSTHREATHKEATHTTHKPAPRPAQTAHKSEKKGERS